MWISYTPFTIVGFANLFLIEDVVKSTMLENIIDWIRRSTHISDSVTTLIQDWDGNLSEGPNLFTLTWLIYN